MKGLYIGSGIYGCAMIIISDIVSLKDRGKYQGIIGAVFGVSSVLGPLIGGLFTDYVSWRWCFYINLPIGLVSVIAFVGFIKLPSPDGSVIQKIKQLDFIGTLLVIAATTTLLIPLTLGGTKWPWNSPQTIAMIVASIILYGLFIYVERKYATNPIVRLPIYKIDPCETF